MHIQGVLVGLMAFGLIGLFHPVVIRAEYHMGKKIWPVFLLLGLVSVLASLWVKAFLLSSFLGILGFSFLWSIQELFAQEKRVQKGWFPANPARVSHGAAGEEGQVKNVLP